MMCGRDGSIYPGREPIGAGTGGYTLGGNQSEQGRAAHARSTHGHAHKAARFGGCTTNGRGVLRTIRRADGNKIG
eukprot:1190342-Prorocentrum_minimum.AAC.1